MHIHILGIAGTFMAGIALLAKQAGHKVTGVDKNIYPPMSTQLEQQGISVVLGYENDNFEPKPDQVVVGNAMTRGNPAIETLLDSNLTYTSGPQWLAENILAKRWVLAVAGTHGKTTTSSLLAWILEYAGLKPGFLIGGIPENFGISARLGESEFFVIEADEYDSAFFDKRSKFIHYRPKTLILNNLEFDHADIFDSIKDIQKQFHHLVRIIPKKGLIIVNQEQTYLQEVLAKELWSPLVSFGGRDSKADWQVEGNQDLKFYHNNQEVGQGSWDLLGKHNAYNALAAILAAQHVGVKLETAIKALAHFKGIKRRMQHLGDINNISIYDDFAHHPTAIKTTLEGLRNKLGSDANILVALDLRSNTMRIGSHKEELADSLKLANQIFIYKPADTAWNVAQALQAIQDKIVIFDTVEALQETLIIKAKPFDTIILMSNGSFGHLAQTLPEKLA